MAQFRPIFDDSGRYRVDIAFPHSTNNINSVRHTVNHLNGTTSNFINQYSSRVAQNWVTLGEFEFSDNFTTKDAGVHTVVVDNPTVTGNLFYSGVIRFDSLSPRANVTDWMNY